MFEMNVILLFLTVASNLVEHFEVGLLIEVIVKVTIKFILWKLGMFHLNAPGNIFWLFLNLDAQIKMYQIKIWDDLGY